jgi:hypothetical protein
MVPIAKLLYLAESALKKYLKEQRLSFPLSVQHQFPTLTQAFPVSPCTVFLLDSICDNAA